MIFRNCDMKSFSQRCKNRKIVCYGIGGEFQRIKKSYVGYEWMNNICMLVDGNPNNKGSIVDINGKKLLISSLEDLRKNITPDMVLLITSMAYYEIILKLNKIDAFKDTECYLFHFMFPLSEGSDYSIKQTSELVIPPVIHYCWFGGKPLPDSYKRYIETWYKYCPDYKIIEWNESTCDVNETIYTRQAYNIGKYGFVPDYFRLKIVYENGGIYLDTDVEILKNLDDLRYNIAFCGIEFPGEVALGLGFGAVKNSKCIKKLMERYKTMHFINDDGSINEVASPVFQSEDLSKMGMNFQNKIQVVEDMTIYPIEVLSPQNVYTGITNISPNTYMWHHFDGSWISGDRLKKKKERLAKSKEILGLMEVNDRKILKYE